MKGLVGATWLLLSVASVARADELSNLIDRYVAWRGGGAFEQLTAFHLRGELDTAGLRGTEDLWAERAGRQRVESDLGVIKQVQVVTPEQAWDTAPNGQVRTMSTADRQSLARDAGLQFSDALRGRNGASARLGPSKTWAGRTWTVVRVTFGDADTYDVLLDPSTGALGGFGIMEDRQGRFESFGDWRVIDGVREPFLQTVRTDTPGGNQTVRVASMALNTRISVSSLERPAPVRKAKFRGGLSSTGWIDFEFYDHNRIFLPAKVNGRVVVVLLDSGASMSAIDKAYAAALGLTTKGAFSAPGSGGIDTASFTNSLEVEVGGLTLKDVHAATLDLEPIAQRIGHPMPFVLGDEVFDELAVDIDFAHHRLAFRDPSNLSRPAGSTEVTFGHGTGHRSVPISIDGASPQPFEFDLGNGSPLDVYPAYYKPHELLAGLRTSEVLAGAVGGYHATTVASLDHVTFAGVAFRHVPTGFTPDILSDANSNLVFGNIGLPILSRFHLVIDFPHDRLWATPDAQATVKPFEKDRLGLSLVKKGDVVQIMFVSPGSPAEKSGLKAGEKIAYIDGAKAKALTDAQVARLRFKEDGSVRSLILSDGTIKILIPSEFY